MMSNCCTNCGEPLDKDHIRRYGERFCSQDCFRDWLVYNDPSDPDEGDE